jgi:8-oxo-dGTP pyrophosphatase MutT (NUDIX family)
VSASDGFPPVPDDGLTTAAVLVPLFRDAAGELRVVLVVRGDRGIHGGQLGLPGGKPEPGDTSLLDTALRETEEEIGIGRDVVEVLAELPPVVTRTTGFRVYPFLGRIPDGLEWRLRPGEIVGLLTPTIASLADPGVRAQLPFRSSSIAEMIVEGIEVEGHVLWGMTLRMLDILMPRLVAGEWDV